MNIETLKERFKGREFWKNINRTLGIGIYSILVFGILLFPKLMLNVLLAMGIIIPSYIAFFLNHLREMEGRERGKEVIGGWIEHAHGVGEPFHFTPLAILPVDRLSETDRNAVDEYINLIIELAKEQIKVDVGTEKNEPQKQLTYQELIDKEKKELEEFDKEYEIWKKERDKEKRELEHNINSYEGLKEEKRNIKLNIKEISENNNKSLEEQFENETGKKAIWKGKKTQAFLDWIKLRSERGIELL
ncbi:MAG: hypothetical protein ACFFDF_01060 [Candidatus Odinarchaeota archaeon]